MTTEDEIIAEKAFIAALDNPDDLSLSKDAELKLKSLIKSNSLGNVEHYEIRLISIIALEIEQYQHTRHKLMKANDIADKFNLFYRNHLKEENDDFLLYEYQMYSGFIFTRYPSFNGTTKDGIRLLKKALVYAEKNAEKDELIRIYYHLAYAYNSLHRKSLAKKYSNKALKLDSSDLTKEKFSPFLLK